MKHGKWVRASVVGIILLLMAFCIPSGSVRAGELTSLRISLPLSDVGGPEPDSGNFTETTYYDPTLSVEIRDGKTGDTKYLCAHIRISDPSQLRSAAATRFSSLTTYIATSIAKRVNAVLAINGDYFNHEQRVGYIVRQGKRYRNAPTGQDLLLIDNHGDFRGLYGPDTREEIEAYLETLPGDVEIWNSFSFGPILVEDGNAVFTENDLYFDVSTNRLTQRVGIGQLGPLEYYIVSTEGPEDDEDSGMTVADFAALMEQIGYELSENGALLAYNLDGGCSNTLVFNNEKINSAARDKIRPVGDIIYFATLMGSGNTSD